MTAIKVEELPVSYVEGKTIEQNREVALQNLDLLLKLSTRVLQTGKLADEINLLTAIQELSSQMQVVATLLYDVNVKDDATVKKLAAWAAPLADLSAGPVNAFFVDTFTYVTSHASELDARQCPCAK